MRTFVKILWFLIALCGTAQGNELDGPPSHGRSTGCGLIQSGTGSFTPVQIRILNQERTYHLRVPLDYDPNRAYPLIFRWHGSGGNGLSGGLGIEHDAGNDAIIVGADGLNTDWRGDADAEELLFYTGNSDLQFATAPADLLFFDRMLEAVSTQYCIDRARVFSYGFSVGAYFSNLLACERGDVLRASAAIAGGPRGGNCRGKVAAWFLHDADDHTIPIAEGKAARDRAVKLNGCTTKTANEGEGCVRYLGCAAAPVIWCESTGYGHDIRGDYAPERVWKFFQTLH